ncbi:phage minor head protein [Pseudomonas citronellolis]|uniref:Phage minor head protein n=1 Tax=Pseudomonas citronellolis TaxID=53408 RepID=A0AAW6P5M3_9PSED|nr:phage minor head protein [Pseudomonas citronellolis]MDF3842743.1 phage minor head protein [Pseudomonas citronellolis]
MPRAAILPANPRDPTGADRLERGAFRDFSKRFRKIRDGYLLALDRIPSEPVVNRRYVFNLDSTLLNVMFSGLDSMVDSILLEGGEDKLWFFESYVSVAYQRGTAQQFANLGQQSPVYHAGQQSLRDILMSEPYRRRIALVRAREFEEMKGLSGTTKNTLNRVLAEGIARGKNPREIAKDISSSVTSLDDVRARRIARTEIPTALRRARMDETDDAQERYGIRTMEMHISALSPTTRRTHAARHATLHTTEEQRDWWAEDANSINCKCSTVSVMVDDNGKPLVPAIVESAKRNKQVMEAKGRGPWAKEE